MSIESQPLCWCTIEPNEMVGRKPNIFLPVNAGETALIACLWGAKLWNSQFCGFRNYGILNVVDFVTSPSTPPQVMEFSILRIPFLCEFTILWFHNYGILNFVDSIIMEFSILRIP